MAAGTHLSPPPCSVLRLSPVTRDVDGSAKGSFNSVDYFPLAALKKKGGGTACLSSLAFQKSKALQERDGGRSAGPPGV